MKAIKYTLVAVLLLAFSYFIFLLVLGSKFTEQKFPYAVYEFDISGEELENKVFEFVNSNNFKIEKYREENNKYTSFKGFSIYKSTLEYDFWIRYRSKEKNINPRIEYNGTMRVSDKKFLEAEEYIPNFENDFIKKLGVAYKRVK